MDKAQAVLDRARKEKPDVRYVLNSERTVIGAWSESLGRYVCVACLALTGEWVSMPYEVLVNGQPMVNKWMEE